MQSGKKVDVLKMLIQTYQRVFIHYGNLYYLKNSYFDNKTNLGDPHFFSDKFIGKKNTFLENVMFRGRLRP